MAFTMAGGGLLLGGIMGVILGSSMLAIGVYLTGTLFGSLNASELTADAQTSYSDVQTKTFTAYKILSIALIVGSFMVIIGTLISMAFF